MYYMNINNIILHNSYAHRFFVLIKRAIDKFEAYTCISNENVRLVKHDKNVVVIISAIQKFA
jgi:hypothetical protein